MDKIIKKVIRRLRTLKLEGVEFSYDSDNGLYDVSTDDEIFNNHLDELARKLDRDSLYGTITSKGLDVRYSGRLGHWVEGDLHYNSLGNPKLELVTLDPNDEDLKDNRIQLIQRLNADGSALIGVYEYTLTEEYTAYLY